MSRAASPRGASIHHKEKVVTVHESLADLDFAGMSSELQWSAEAEMQRGNTWQRKAEGYLIWILDTKMYPSTAATAVAASGHDRAWTEPAGSQSSSASHTDGLQQRLDKTVHPVLPARLGNGEFRRRQARHFSQIFFSAAVA